MTATRQTSLKYIAWKFGDIRPGALGRQSASNGELSLRITLELLITPELAIRLTELLCLLAVTVNATSELEYLAACPLRT